MSTPLTIREPASAVAAGRCLNARVYDRDRWLTTDHPSRCVWCDFPKELLADMVAEFHEWSGWSERRRTFGHHELRLWAELKAADQRASILVAQALEDEPPPAPGRIAAVARAAAAEALEPAPEPVQVAAAAPASRPSWAKGGAS